MKTRIATENYSGCLLGGALGDALGWPVEFQFSKVIISEYGPNGIEEMADAPGGVGAITDDTQLTLFTVEGLLNAHPAGALHHCTSYLHSAYMRWLAT